VRQSIHAPLHSAQEVLRVGPPVCSSQWTMERTIGNLTEEIRQPSNPYSNLSQRGLCRSQINALKVMIPDLIPPINPLPRGSKDVGNGYVLLRAMEKNPRPLQENEAVALRVYIQEVGGQTLPHDWCPSVSRWARLRLPNGQIARSLWKESQKPLERLRIARNVKASRLLYLSSNINFIVHS
jgi:hypothetical protein